jgi:hypothetical protein
MEKKRERRKEHAHISSLYTCTNSRGFYTTGIRLFVECSMFYRVHFVGHLVKQMCPVVLADVLRKPLHGNEGLGVVVDARDVGEVPCGKMTEKKSHENAREFIARVSNFFYG